MFWRQFKPHPYPAFLVHFERGARGKPDFYIVQTYGAMADRAPERVSPYLRPIQNGTGPSASAFIYGQLGQFKVQGFRQNWLV